MITLVDLSTHSPGRAVLERIAAAVTEQVHRDLAPAWDRLPVEIAVAPDVDAPGDAIPVVIFDDADQAGVLGFHTETPAGRPYARVFATPVLQHGGGWTDGPVAVSSVVSHEVTELIVDPAINLWAGDHAQTAYALEVADPVENGSYAIAVRDESVAVSNFVLPAWFDARAPGPYDHLSRVTGPFELDAGGYAIVAPEGQPRQVFGEFVAASWWRATKTDPASRTARRLRVDRASALDVPRHRALA
jgi:hypothetical protein